METPIEMTLPEIARMVDGTLSQDTRTIITGVCPLEDPQPNCITFCSTKEIRNISVRISASKLAAILIADKVPDTMLVDSKIPFIKVSDPQRALLKLVSIFHPEDRLKAEISEHAIVADSATIGKNVAIAALAVIGEHVVIGDDVQIHPHAVIYRGVTIGSRSIIHAGAIIRENCIIGEGCVIQCSTVIGADGFGYLPGPDGSLEHVRQVGIVTLGDQVEVGANSCIDRATMGSTRLGTHSKVDNLVQIGHNVQIGRSSIICGGAGIGGSTKIGHGVVIGGQTGVADHVTITDGVRIGGNAGVEGSITEKGDYMGFPLSPATTWRKYRARFALLPEVIRSYKAKKKQDLL